MARGLAHAAARAVGRDARHAQAVDRAQLAGDLGRGAGHAAKVDVAPEEALVADARQRLALRGHFHALLHLDQLVQAALPGAVGHQAPGVLVDDLHLALAHEVVLVALEHVQRGERLAHELLAPARPLPDPAQVLGDALQRLLAGVGDLDALLADAVVGLAQRAGDLERVAVHLLARAALRAGRQDERRARLVHQHAVGLVDDRELQPAQQQARRRRRIAGERAQAQRDRVRLAAEHQAVAQVVEGDLLVAAVGHVAGIGGAPHRRLLPLLHAAHAQAEQLVHRRHLHRVALGEVVVHRHHVHRASRERRGRRGQGRGQGLAFAGVHLGDHAAQHRPSADQLDVEVAHARGAHRRLAHQRERLRHQLELVEPAAAQLRPQRRGARAQLGVRGFPEPFRL